MRGARWLQTKTPMHDLRRETSVLIAPEVVSAKATERHPTLRDGEHADGLSVALFFKRLLTATVAASRHE